MDTRSCDRGGLQFISHLLSAFELCASLHLEINKMTSDDQFFFDYVSLELQLHSQC